MRALRLHRADLRRGKDAHLVVDDEHVEGPLPGAGDLRRLQQRLDQDPAGVVPNKPPEPQTPRRLGRRHPHPHRLAHQPASPVVRTTWIPALAAEPPDAASAALNLSAVALSTATTT